MSDSAVADRYARAVFELGVETGQVERLTEDLKKAAEVVASSVELRAVLDNPLVDQNDRDAVLKELAVRLGLSELGTNSMRLLAQRRRLAVLPQIARRLGGLADEKAGVLRAQVVSAHALSDGLCEQLKQKLEQATNKRVLLERQEDPSLVAGIVTRIGDNTIDGSLKGRLADLERQLLQA